MRSVRNVVEDSITNSRVVSGAFGETENVLISKALATHKQITPATHESMYYKINSYSWEGEPFK